MKNNKPQKRIMPTGLSFWYVIFIILSMVMTLVNFSLQEEESTFAALGAIIAVVFITIMVNKKVDEQKIGQAYSILISGLFLLNFGLFFSCLLNLKLNIH